ncbi:MAG: tRNA pseudouridine(38-40) synthase TruA [Acetatifactor sp.]|nr:tRNA pseudouridine(38-40) synthase TruA [Acetatifactor sp.]
MEKKRVRLVVAYDGTAYHGWQYQNNAVTVEEKLHDAIFNLTKEDVEVVGASRTDAGVHSLGNIAVFDTDSPIPADKFSFALNQYLPEDIRVLKSDEVSPDWHPRKVNSKKTYEYRIYNAPIPLPTKRLYADFEYGDFDVEAMNEAAAFLIGEHDFKSFCSEGAQVLTTVRLLYDAKVYREDTDIVIRVTGAGFLYNMVRIIAGTLMEVGRGKRAASEMPKIIEACDRQAAGPTAPARGLTLIKYEFE